jgi:sialic acid synthase SpsE
MSPALAAEIRLGARAVGPGHPCYVIAEAGSNHNGSLDLAHDLIDAAAAAGADAVKFQVFSAETLMVRDGPTATYLKEALGEQTLFELFQTTAVDRSWLPLLAARSGQRGIDFLATPFDVRAVEDLIATDVGVVAMKNASSELWHAPLLEALARTQLPLLLSTGMADIDDVDHAVAAFTAAGGRELCLLHCTVCYPAPSESLNLQAITTLRERYGAPVGLSDHSTETWAAVAAVTLGANVIEKHFTLDRSLPGPDHGFALEPHALAEMVADIRQVEAALGDGVKRRQPSEEDIFLIGRRNLVMRHAAAAGDTISRDDLDVLRSPLGLSAFDLSSVVGHRLTRSVQEGDTLRWEDLD